jgi:hypothetical protein
MISGILAKRTFQRGPAVAKQIVGKPQTWVQVLVVRDVLHRRQAPFRYEETGGKHLFWRRRVDVVETGRQVQRQTLRQAPLILRVERDIPQRFAERPLARRRA